MSLATRKGYVTVSVNGPQGKTHISIKKGSKVERIALHRMRKQMRDRKHQERAYKDKLRAAKKRFPIEERSHLSLEDL